MKATKKPKILPRVEYESHERFAEYNFSPREFRELVIQALVERGVECRDAEVSLNFYSAGFECKSNNISSGPSVQVWIRKQL